VIVSLSAVPVGVSALGVPLMIIVSAPLLEQRAGNQQPAALHQLRKLAVKRAACDPFPNSGARVVTNCRRQEGPQRAPSNPSG